MHASYTELCQFVSYLQPRRVVPCVVALGDATLSDVQARCVRMLKTWDYEASDLFYKCAHDVMSCLSPHKVTKLAAEFSCGVQCVDGW